MKAGGINLSVCFLGVARSSASRWLSNGPTVLNFRSRRRLSEPLKANEGIWASKHCSMVWLETPPGKLKRKENRLGPEELVPWQRVLAAFAEDLGLVPNTHMVAHKCL